MNIIERYVSSYIVHCLFPEQTISTEHLDYVYQVLRETRSTPPNSLIRQVLDFTRQTDPSDPATQETVRKYVLAMATNAKPEPKRDGYLAQYKVTEIAIVFVVSRDGHPVAFAGCAPDSFEQCKAELQETFKNIEFEAID